MTCNHNLEIFTATTKGKSGEPTYSQTLIQDKIDRQGVKIKRVRQAGRQTVRRLRKCLELRKGGREEKMNQDRICCRAEFLMQKISS